MKTKICTKCKIEKSILFFSIHKNYKDNFSSWCKDCIKENSKIWYKKNKKDIQKKHKIYYESNKNNKDFKLKYSQNNYNWNIKNYKYRQEYLKIYNKKYYKLNKQKIINKAKIYIRNKLKTDINFRIKQNLRTRIWEVLKRNSKSKSTLELLGCTVEQLKKHLEKQFKDGMTWNNYGKGGWVIDHILPCASFDLSDPLQQKECFHYSNLQPLLEKDNLIKSNKILATIS